jgi:hypothetical protein
MASLYVDFYKSIRLHRGELLIGAGPAFGHLEFNTPPSGDGAKYAGGGVTVFSQGSYPILRRRRWELGVTGMARITLLSGDWHIDPPWWITYPTSEHSNSMSIVELGIGPELRRQFGRSARHYLFARAIAEFQQWRSDRMGPMAGDTLALQGASISAGFGW